MLQRKPGLGWRTSDEDEIDLRRECRPGAAPSSGVAAWRAMRRLADADLLQFSFEARELHRALGLPADSPVAASAAPRGAEAIAEADRALRMAKTLADGGFPEEAPALLAKSLRAMTTASLAARSEAPVHGQSAADSDIRRLVDYGALPSEAVALLEETQSLSSAAVIEGVAPALAGAARILATIIRNEPGLTARTK